MALSRPFSEDPRELPLSTPVTTPPGDRWCDVYGFVPAGGVSGSSTLQIIRDAIHLSWCLLRVLLPGYMLGHHPRLPHVQGSTPTGFSKAGYVEWASHPIFHLACMHPCMYKDLANLN